MKPYPKYKDSGIEWIGEIPEGWAFKRLKHICKINPIKGASSFSSDSSQPVTFLPMEKVHEDGSFDHSEKKPINELWNGFTYFEEKDVIMAKITPCFENGKGAYLESLGSKIGFGSTEFHVLRSLPHVSNPKYLYYLSSSSNFRHPAISFMTGAAGQKRVPTDFIEEYYLGCPSISEQKAIASFLDRKTKQIDELIEKKRRMIELLKEQRTAIINHAVTKGLNPNAPMKDSGIEWLGEIPAHWEVNKIKYLMKFFSGGTPSTDNLDYWNGGIPWVSPKDMKYDVINNTEDTVSQKAVDNGKTSFLLPKGAVLLVVRSGILRHTIPVAIAGMELTINQDIKGILPIDNKCDAGYFSALVRGAQAKLLPIWSKMGATVESLETDQVRNTAVTLPPKKEQKSIVDYICQKVNEAEIALSKEEQSIELLQKYRTALISNAVTGKIDVREDN